VAVEQLPRTWVWSKLTAVSAMGVWQLAHRSVDRMCWPGLAVARTVCRAVTGAAIGRGPLKHGIGRDRTRRAVRCWPDELEAGRQVSKLARVCAAKPCGISRERESSAASARNPAMALPLIDHTFVCRDTHAPLVHPCALSS